MHLNDRDHATLSDVDRATAACAMRLLVRFAVAVGAPSPINAEAAPIDGFLYHGQVSLDFVEHLVDLDGRVRWPTTLNVGSVDLVHP